MLERFTPAALFRGQYKSLSDYRGENPKPAWIERILTFLTPIMAGVAMWFFNGSIADPNSLLAGAALFAGALISAFAQLSSWRDRLTERAAKYRLSESVDRDALDESATHLLAASYVSALAAAFLILAINFGSDCDGSVTGPFAWLATACGVYVFMVFLIALPRLYKNYVMINKVRTDLDGTSS
ncbi:hypothetical protein QMQ05_05610 [Glutamicibacter ectropisis]|uniref:Uncharacterized protein n=1 Tax=Glutamicibacter ectropisis TaxID=3046593 RepID=A0AAU6WH28_9MICC